MIQDLQGIEYRRGMLEEGMQPDDLPIKSWTGSEIPPDVRESIEKKDLLTLGKEVGQAVNALRASCCGALSVCWE